MAEPVRLEITEGIARLTLNRPEAYNALDMELVDALSERLIELAEDQSVIAVVITGEGKAFCAGGDLRWVSDSDKSNGAALYDLAANFHQSILSIRRMPKPVIAAINGLATGGGFSLALACDFRVIDLSAVLIQVYTSNGFSIDGGGTFTLPRMVGMARAMEIIAFDRPISADQALAWGLVTEVVNEGQALEGAVNLVQEIKKRAPFSFAATKRLINDSFQSSLEAQLKKEQDALALCGDHPNGREGIAAFLEKRKPVYNS